MVNIFYKDYSKKPTVISAPLDSTPPMTKPTVKLSTKQKIECQIKIAIKRIKYKREVVYIRLGQVLL